MARTTGTRLQAVDEVEQELLGEETVAPNVSRGDHEALTNLLFTTLRALSNRAITALGNLYALALAASTFWVYLTILGAPSVRQLIGAGMYSVFTIGCIFLRRRPT